MEDTFRSTSNPVQGHPVQGRYADPVPRNAFGPRSLETFVDLGLSDRQIARYFRTSETQIVSLRRHYGLS